MNLDTLKFHFTKNLLRYASLYTFILTHCFSIIDGIDMELKTHISDNEILTCIISKSIKEDKLVSFNKYSGQGPSAA